MLDAMQETGIQLFTSGNYEEAARHFATALLREERAELWNDWASARTAGGHLLEALEGFRCASLLEPDNAEVNSNFTALTLALEQRRAAVNANQAVRDRATMRRIAITSFQNGQHEDAAQILQELLLVAESVELWNDLGTVHVAAGNFLDAELAYRRALALDSSNTTASSNLVILLERTGRPDKALIWKDTSSAEAMEQVRGSTIGPHASRQRGGQIASELMTAISALPSYPPDMPPEMAEALAVNRSDSSYFVALCRKLVEDIPAEWKMNAWTELANGAGADYRMNLVIGAALLDQRDYEAALPLIQTAFDANPLDLYADRLLDRCVNGMAGDETATDKYLSTHFCGDPWKHFEISQTGHVYQCCPGWLTVPVGKMGEASAEELWNSHVAQEVRSSIADGSFKFCSRSHCPKIAGRTLPPKTLTQIAVGETASHLARVPTLPKKLVLAYDRTCNLACPQCRSDFVIASPGRRNEMDSYIPAILEIAEQADALHLNGSGELFGSRHTRELLQLITRERFPLLKFHIISNGQLFDRRAYEQFDLQGRIGSLQISVDAATPETYSIVRFPGNFDRLLKNLHFLDELRLNENQHFNLNLCFVVSGKNYREMPDFVRVGRSLHADTITFTRFRNWGSFTAEEFNKMNITDPAHPEHQDFLNTLEHPELLDPTVDLGSVRSFRPANNTGPVNSDQSPGPNQPAQEQSHSTSLVPDNGPEKFLEAALNGSPQATELWTRFVVCLTRKLDAMGDGPRQTAEKVNIAGYFISTLLRNFYRGSEDEFFWKPGDIRNAVFHLAESLGLHILPTHFYSPVPAAPQLSSQLWERPSTLPGIDMNESGQLELLSAFSKFRQECDNLPVRKPAGSPPHTFFLENGSYQSIDAEVLYSMVRHFKPRNICEIGSGNSTLLSAQAIAANRQEDSAYTCELTAIEPYPSQILKAGFPGLTRLIQSSVQDVPFSEFARLEENGILFIDSSHVLKIGNDVQHEFLEILPRLKKGVLIHIHDIFLPFEYPVEWVMKMNRYWTEQYLLQAFLIGNRAFEVLNAGSYLHAKHADALEATFSRYRKGQSWSPGYFWMRKVE